MKVLFFLVCLLPLVFVRADDKKRFILSNLKDIVKQLLDSGVAESECEKECAKLAKGVSFLCGPTCQEVAKALGK